MVASKATVFMQGKGYWMKIFGEPRPNFNRDGREWTFEFEPDENGVKALEEHKLADRLKDKGDKPGYEGRGKFLTLKKSELSKEGTPNKHIRVYNDQNEDWDAETLIGNGSDIVVKLDIRDYGPGKKKGVYPVAIRVKDLVPYQSNEFGAFDTENGNVAPSGGSKDTFKEDFGLDDDIPL